MVRLRTVSSFVCRTLFLPTRREKMCGVCLFQGGVCLAASVFFLLPFAKICPSVILPFCVFVCPHLVILSFQIAQHFQASRHHVYKRIKRARKTHIFSSYTRTGDLRGTSGGAGAAPRLRLVVRARRLFYALNSST